MEKEFIIITYIPLGIAGAKKYKVRKSELDNKVQSIIKAGMLIEYIFPVEFDVKKEYGIA